MPERSVDINLDKISETEIKEEFKKLETRAEKKARIVSILSRSVVADRLSVPLPDDKYGEWVPNDKMEILRKQGMGFTIDTEYAKNRALHQDSNTGDGSSVVGDVVFMVCDKEIKEIIDEHYLELYKAANSPRSGRQKEEKDFEDETQRVGLPAEIKSRVDSATRDDIISAMSAKD